MCTSKSVLLDGVPGIAIPCAKKECQSKGLMFDIVFNVIPNHSGELTLNIQGAPTNKAFWVFSSN